MSSADEWQGAPKLIKKKFQPREMGIDANTVAGALRPSSVRATLASRHAVFENMGDAQPKYTINLERCELLRVSALALVPQSQAW